MVWFFERANESIQLETLYDNDKSEFVAVVRYADGRQETTAFKKREIFWSWLEAFERDLTAQSWSSQGSPIVLPYGWPDKPLKE